MGDLNWLQWMRWLRDINFPVMNLLWRRPVMIVMWMATHPNNRCLFPFWFPVKCIFCWRWRLVRHSVFLLAIASSILEVQGHRSGALAQLAVWVVSLSTWWIMPQLKTFETIMKGMQSEFGSVGSWMPHFYKKSIWNTNSKYYYLSCLDLTSNGLHAVYILYYMFRCNANSWVRQDSQNVIREICNE